MQNRTSIDKVTPSFESSPAVRPQKDDKLILEEIKKIPIEEILKGLTLDGTFIEAENFHKLPPSLEEYTSFFGHLIEILLHHFTSNPSISNLIYKKFDEVMKLMDLNNLSIEIDIIGWFMYLGDPIIYDSFKENLNRNPSFKKKLLDIRSNCTLDVTQDMQLEMLFFRDKDNPNNITPKGHALLGHYYNTKDNELYGYFPVGYYDVDNSFHYLLSLLDKAKEGTQFIMLYRFDPEADIKPNITPIKCEKKNGKIHLIFAESYPSNPDYSLDMLLNDRFSHRLSSISSKICIYKNTRDLHSNHDICYTLSLKYGRQLKQNDILSSLLKTKLSPKQSSLHSWPIFHYEVPPYLMYLVSSTKQLDRYLGEVNGAKEAKLGFEQLSFKEYVFKNRIYPKKLKPFTRPEIISPHIIQDEKNLLKSKAIFCYQAKYRDIIKNYFATMSQEELKTAIELMDPLQWHVNSKGEIVHRWVTTIMEGLENKEHKEILALLDKHPSLMHRALNEKGQSLLHLAVEWSNQEVIKYLVSHNANVNFKDKEYLTALEWGNKLTKKYLNHKGGIFLQESILAYKEKKESLAQFKTLLHKQSQSKKKRKNTSTFFKNKSQKNELGGNPDKEKLFQSK